MFGFRVHYDGLLYWGLGVLFGVDMRQVQN